MMGDILFCCFIFLVIGAGMKREEMEEVNGSFSAIAGRETLIPPPLCSPDVKERLTKWIHALYTAAQREKLPTLFRERDSRWRNHPLRSRTP
jgi:hypothetical protein